MGREAIVLASEAGSEANASSQLAEPISADVCTLIATSHWKYFNYQEAVQAFG